MLGRSEGGEGGHDLFAVLGAMTEAVERARALMAQRFPSMRDAPLLEARVCQYENSPDGHLIIDRHPDATNAWLVGGGSGHGFKLAPAVGKALAQSMLGQDTVVPLESYRLGRFADDELLRGAYGIGSIS